MNKKASKSCKALLKKRPKEVQAIIVFGSQARGDERLGSDLDILCIVENKLGYEKWIKLHGHIARILSCDGGIDDATIFIDGWKEVQNMCNIYDAEHYNIVREGIVIYGDINKLQINKKIDYAKSVKYWLEQADKNISKFKSEIKHKQPSWGMYSYGCIGDMLRAVMLAKHIQIQFTRNIVEYAHALNLPDIDKIIKFADWYTSCRLQKNYQDTTLLNKTQITKLTHQIHKWGHNQVLDDTRITV